MIMLLSYLPHNLLTHRQFCIHKLHLQESPLPLQHAYSCRSLQGIQGLFHVLHTLRFQYRYDRLKEVSNIARYNLWENIYEKKKHQ